MNEVLELLLKQPRAEHQWIGLEVERLGINSEGQVLRYEPDMHGLLRDLVAEKAWRVDYEPDGKLLGIQKNLSAISLEPGAQFEISLAPRKSIHEIEKLQLELDAEVASIKRARDWRWISMGVNPWETPESMSLLPSPRYRLMDSYFRKFGTRGREMMRLTTGLQVNLDFANEKEGVELLRGAFIMAPFLMAMFANAPYFHQKRSAALSERHLIWRGMDPLRGGIMDFVFAENFTLEKYCEVVASTPLMYAYDENGEVFDPEGKALKDLSKSLQKKNALAAMRQLFQEARFKPCCVEVRCFDQLPDELRYAATAVVVGVLYSPENRERLMTWARDFSPERLRELMLEGAMTGLRSGEIFTRAKILIEWAEKGISARGLQEEKYLKPAQELVFNRKTPAERLIEKYGERFRA